MAGINDGLAAQADEIRRALQEADAPPQMRGIDIIAALEMDPNLTLDDVLGSRPDPQTLAGTGPVQRPRGELLPVPLPDLPQRAPNAVEFGEGLQPQSRPEAREIARDAAGVGQGALVAANVAAAHPVGRAVTAIPKVVAAAPKVAAGVAGLAGLTFGSAEAEAPGRDTSSSQAALDRMIAQRDEMQAQRKTLTDERSAFTNPSTPAEIRRAQERLNALGYDAGTPDGNPGGKWRDALKRYNADRTRELQEITQQINGLGPQITDAQKQVRLDQAAANKEKGNRRITEINANTPWYEKALRDYGPYAAGMLGLGSSVWLRGKLGKYANDSLETTAQRADALMAQGGKGGVPGRVGRVNQFWAEGHAGRQEPFTPTARRRPPYTPNADAPPAADLYQPSLLNRWGPAAGVATSGAIEFGGGEAFFVPHAQAEVAAAQEALSNDPNNEANIQRLNTAKNQLAMAQALSWFGRGTLAGVVPAEFKARAGYTPPRPNVSAAEAERGLLTQLMQPGGRSRSSAPPAHPSHVQPRRPDGRFKGE